MATWWDYNPGPPASYRARGATLDGAGPVLGNPTAPPTVVAGRPAQLSVTATDVWSAVCEHQLDLWRWRHRLGSQRKPHLPEGGALQPQLPPRPMPSAMRAAPRGRSRWCRWPPAGKRSRSARRCPRGRRPSAAQGEPGDRQAQRQGTAHHQEARAEDHDHPRRLPPQRHAAAQEEHQARAHRHRQNQRGCHQARPPSAPPPASAALATQPVQPPRQASSLASAGAIALKHESGLPTTQIVVPGD